MDYVDRFEKFFINAVGIFLLIILVLLVVLVFDSIFFEPQADAKAVEYCNSLGDDLVPKDVPRYFLSPEPLGVSCMKNTYLNVKEESK